MGTLEQRELHHERDDVRGFYSQFSGEVIIGIEACAFRAALKHSGLAKRAHVHSLRHSYATHLAGDRRRALSRIRPFAINRFDQCA